MKIGILTFHSVDNYGAVLQAFALQTFLASRGHDVEIIDYRPAYFHVGRRWNTIRPTRLVTNMALAYHGGKFESFRAAKLRRSPVCRSVGDLETNLPNYDAMIVGSDQVWSPNVDRRTETDPVFFFRWKMPASVFKMGYAASFGTESIPAEHAAAVADGLANVDVVSVRENSGVEIVRQLAGKAAAWVCDPVFLLSPDTWRDVAGAREGRGRDYLTYMPPCVQVLRDFARRRRVCVRHTVWNPYFALLGGLRVDLPSPLGWVRAVSHCQGFITKSFHGVSFSILLHTPFVFIHPSGAMASRATRVRSVLERVGLLDRMVSEDELTAERLEQVFAAPVDWAPVDAAREAFAAESREFLVRSLEQARSPSCE